MISESKDEMAWRLVWSSQWRLQQESQHIEPTLPKMIGHLSVYNHVSSYMQTHDVSAYGSPECEIDTDVGQVEDFILGRDDDEIDNLLPSHPIPPVPENTTTTQSTPPPLVRSNSIVTVVEIDGVEAEAEAERNPFSDDEETSRDEDAEDDDDGDDGGWSSDDETEFGSVSSVEDETEIKDPVASKLSAINEEESQASMEAFLNGQTT